MYVPWHFNQLFNLLEEECKQLDLEMAARQSGVDLGGSTFQCYIAALKQLSTLKKQHRMNSKGTHCHPAANIPLTFSNPQQSPAVHQLRQEASLAQTEQLDALVSIHAIKQY